MVLTSVKPNHSNIDFNDSGTLELQVFPFVSLVLADADVQG
jgi:hypothetical protein